MAVMVCVGVQLTAARPRRAAGALPRLGVALADLRADFDELLFICRDAQAKLTRVEAELDAASLHPPTRTLLADQRASSDRRYRLVAERLLSLRVEADHRSPEPSLIARLAGEKAELADLLRTEQALTAALAGAGDWQSPSFLHSTTPAAGRHEGRIQAHWNDYKRDRHLDADAFERQYVAQLVDGQQDLRALLTTCGMAAFTTVLSFLAMEGKLDGPVLAGEGLYHESRLLLERAAPGRLHVADERGVPLAIAIEELRPSAVFLDSLSNTKWMPVPDLPRVMEGLAGRGTYLVLDNTCASVGCQPFVLAGDRVRLIVFESLLKYAQLGLDRANAGVVVARADDAEALSEYREHLGTNVSDVAVHALPRPDRDVLTRRLSRLERNALSLGRQLGSQLAPMVEIVYPGFPSHSCADAARELTFRGGCVSIVLGEGDAGLHRERALVERAVAEAARRDVALLAGSSFGFDTSRIYLTAARADHGEPFVRVAAGTESELEITRIADVLVAAFHQVLP